jgi:hypothetical protein
LQTSAPCRFIAAARSDKIRNKDRDQVYGQLNGGMSANCIYPKPCDYPIDPIAIVVRTDARRLSSALDMPDPQENESHHEQRIR